MMGAATLSLSLLCVALAAATQPPPPTREALVTQALDHFRFDETRSFQQKLLVNDDAWKPGGPALVYGTTRPARSSSSSR